MCHFKDCPLKTRKGCSGRIDFIKEILVFCPSYLDGFSKCNRLFYLKRKAEKQLYERFNFKVK